MADDEQEEIEPPDTEGTGDGEEEEQEGQDPPPAAPNEGEIGPSKGPVEANDETTGEADETDQADQEPPASATVNQGDGGEEQKVGAAKPTTSAPADVIPPARRVDAPIGAVRNVAQAASETEESDVPEDVRKYDRFKKVDGAQYERVNEFLRERTYITAREWAIARLCSDFRTETGVEMTKIGENLPHLVPFMTDTYTPQAVNQARSAFETKVTKSGATFLYGAMSDFFSADELDEVMYEVTEVAKFLLEVEGVDLAVDEELEGEERISSVMREVRSASDELRHDGTTCPNCGHEIGQD